MLWYFDPRLCAVANRTPAWDGNHGCEKPFGVRDLSLLFGGGIHSFALLRCAVTASAEQLPCGSVPLQSPPAANQGSRLLVQLDQTSQMLVTIVCDLLVACEQLLCALREGTGQAAVTGLVCQ